MSDANPIRFEGETQAYRAARNELLAAEKALRQQVSEVAELRSALPLGHLVEQDYIFERQSLDAAVPEQVSLSSLFRLPERSLVIYSFMHVEDDAPCPMCNAFLDSFSGVVPHVGQALNVAVVAKAGPAQLAQWAKVRGWGELPLLSSAKNRYNQDFLAESAEGQQYPLLTVFRQTANGIYHTYTTELFFQPPEPGQHPRHVDMVFPLWNLFDFTAEGRPAGWMPNLD